MCQWVRRRGVVMMAAVCFLVACRAATVDAGTVPPPVLEPVNTLPAAAADPVAAPDNFATERWVSAAAFDTATVGNVPLRAVSGETDLEPAQPSVIPLPSAAWTGAAGLFTLAIAKVLRKSRRLLV